MLKLFDLTLRLNGFPIAKAKKELSEIINLDEEAFELFLEKKSRKLLIFICKITVFIGI